MAETRAVARKSSLPPTAAWLAGGGLFLALVFGAGILIQTPSGVGFLQTMRWLFSTDSSQTTWYITRAAGLTSYMLFWLSVAWGMAVSSKILERFLHGSFSYDFHEFLSLAALGFLALHMGSLLFDSYMPYSVAQLLVPFLSPYRPIWVGLGVIAMYLSVLVTVTFYIRKRIGMKAFRVIHYLSLLSYLGATIHGLVSGTDSSLPAVLFLYAGSFLVVIFLVAYWIFQIAQKKSTRKPLTPAPSPSRQTAARL